MRRPLTFKKRDVTRAARGVLAAGVRIERVQIDKNGTINIIAGKADEPSEADEAPDDLRKLI